MARSRGWGFGVINIEASCRELIACQVELVSEWARKFGLDMILTAAPSEGNFTVTSGKWTFRRHGLGVCFTHRLSNQCVDIHDKFDEPELFDAWRLELFLESRGILFRGKKLAEALNKLSTLTQVGRHFKFTCDSNRCQARQSRISAQNEQSNS